MTKSGLEIGANLLFWLLTAWLITSSFSIESHEITVENGVETVNLVRDVLIIKKLLICIFISMVLFYFNFSNLIHLNKGIKSPYIFIKSGLYLLLAFAVYNFFEKLSADPLGLPKSITWGSITFYFTISTAYAIVKVWQQTEFQRQRLILEKKQAELTLLRAQLHPHFLFNVLNNLLAMVDQNKNPALADSLDRLSGLLRYVVYDTEGAKVPVQKEIEFIKNFAELQSLRFEQEELDFELEVIGPFDKQAIEPGIFIPFIENAFKYGLEPEKQSRISVSFDLSEADRIKFVVVNPIHPAMLAQDGRGSGILSSKERLDLVYPDQHVLSIERAPNFKVALEIKTNESNYCR